MWHGCPHGDCKVKNIRLNIAGNNLVNRTISELYLFIFVTHVYSEFQLEMSMNDRDIEWQQEINLIF